MLFLSSLLTQLHSIALFSLFFTVRFGESSSEIFLFQERKILKNLENKGLSSLKTNVIMQDNTKTSLIA